VVITAAAASAAPAQGVKHVTLAANASILARRVVQAKSVAIMVAVAVAVRAPA